MIVSKSKKTTSGLISYRKAKDRRSEQAKASNRREAARYVFPRSKLKVALNRKMLGVSLVMRRSFHSALMVDLSQLGMGFVTARDLFDKGDRLVFQLQLSDIHEFELSGEIVYKKVVRHKTRGNLYRFGCRFDDISRTSDKYGQELTRLQVFLRGLDD